MKFLSDLNNNPTVASVVLIVLLLITEVIRYVKRLYYGFDGIKAEEHTLNKKYKLHLMKELVDVDKINKDVFIIQVVTLVISGILIFLTNIIIGFVAYILLSVLASRFYYKKTGEYYKSLKKNLVKEEKKKKSKKK